MNKITRTMAIHKQVTRDDLNILFCHLISCDEVTRAASQKLKVEYFDESELHYKLIWSIVLWFYTEHKQLPTKTYMQAELTKRIELDPDLNLPHIVEAINELVETAYHFQDFIPSYVFDVLESFLFQRTVGTKIAALSKDGWIEPEAWERLVSAGNSYTIERTGEITPFSTKADPMVGILPRESVGVTFIDMMLGGGVRNGEVYGFLAPSGGGKTTLSNQIAIECAKKGKQMLVCSYEQQVDNEYMVPIYACATGIPRHIWEKVRNKEDILAQLNPEQQHKFELTRQSINNCLHYVDHSGIGHTRAGFGGAAEVDNKIVEFEERNGVKLNGIILDWFWPMVTRAYNSLKLGYGKSQDQRVFAQSVIDELHVIATRRKCWIWLNHQLNPAESKKKRSMEFEDAAELKSFAWYLNGCFCLTKLDEDEMIGTLKFSKARNQKLSSKVIKLEGGIARFIDVSGGTTYDKNQGKYVDPTTANLIPANNEKTKQQREFEPPCNF